MIVLVMGGGNNKSMDTWVTKVRRYVGNNKFVDTFDMRNLRSFCVSVVHVVREEEKAT